MISDTQMAFCIWDAFFKKGIIFSEFLSHVMKIINISFSLERQTRMMDSLLSDVLSDVAIFDILTESKQLFLNSLTEGNCLFVCDLLTIWYHEQVLAAVITLAMAGIPCICRWWIPNGLLAIIYL